MWPSVAPVGRPDGLQSDAPPHIAVTLFLSVRGFVWVVSDVRGAAERLAEEFRNVDNTLELMHIHNDRILAFLKDQSALMSCISRCSAN